MSHRSSKHYERSLVLIKPDGVQRGLIGDIVQRFEKKGLKIVAMKMIHPDEDMASRHYYWSDEEKMATGQRTLDAYASQGLEETRDPIEIAEEVQMQLRRTLSAGPVVAMVIEGAHAIAHVRKIRGAGNPLQADIGSITADLTIDSYLLADETSRAARNVAHASSSVDEAEREIKVWFTENEIMSYDLAIEKILYSMEWENK